MLDIAITLEDIAKSWWSHYRCDPSRDYRFKKFHRKLGGFKNYGAKTPVSFEEILSSFSKPFVIHIICYLDIPNTKKIKFIEHLLDCCELQEPDQFSKIALAILEAGARPTATTSYNDYFLRVKNMLRLFIKKLI